MATINVNSSIILEAVLDGTTIVSRLLSGGDYPLLQRFNSANGTVTPDFTQTLDGVKPYIYPLVMHSDGSGLCHIVECTFTYNGKDAATYKAAENEFLVKSEFAHLFEIFAKNVEVTAVSGVSGTTTVSVPALSFIGNLYTVDNRDTDLIGCYGTVEVGGYMVQFTGLHQEFIIEEETSSMYALWLTVSDGGVISNKQGSCIITPHMDVTGDLKEDAFSSNSRYKIRYYKVTPTGKVQITGISDGFTIDNANNNYSLTVPASVVDSNLTVFVELIDTRTAINKRLASASTVIQDISDPCDIQWQVSDSGEAGYEPNCVSGNTVKRGGQARVRAMVINRSTGTAATGTWNFLLVGYKNNGEMLESATSPTNPFMFDSDTALVSHDDILRAQRKLTLHCFASQDKTVIGNKDSGMYKELLKKYEAEYNFKLEQQKPEPVG